MWCFRGSKFEVSPASRGPADVRIPSLEPHHKVFLSHSGYQKPFVEQLCEDLVAHTYIPFFDQRNDSLPKGEKFAKLIFDAARQCHVGVVVLSEEYLTSKWPMLELVEFCKAADEKRKAGDQFVRVLPLYYKLSIGQIKDDSNKTRWRKKWTSFAKKDKRIDLRDWENALKLLQDVNGISLPADGSEVSYRRDIVKKIWYLCPPHVPYDLDEKEGWERICKVLSGLFVADEGVEKLGIYGMGGLGKTTICKGMCNYFHGHFFGRVFHLELVSGRKQLDLQKQMLKTLFRLGDDILQTVASSDEVVTCLNKHAGTHPVLLIIDNVQDDHDSQEEARGYLKAKFCEGSKVVITSRSRVALEKLLPGPEFRKAMPELERDEAARIFLRRAVRHEKRLFSLDPRENKVLDTCLEQCSFSMEGDSWHRSKKRHGRRGQYHPLALTALASYLERKAQGNSNLSQWEPHLRGFDKLKLSNDSDRMFGILGMQLRTFTKPKKLLFFDVAIYSRGEVELDLTSVDGWCDWLAMVNPDMGEEELKSELDDLKDVGIIDWGYSTIAIHELYKEYAEWCLSRWGREAENLHEEVWCVRHKPSYGKSLPRALERRAPSGWWPDLERLWLEGMKTACPISALEVQEWRNVVVLQLHNCSSVRELDLHMFCCVRHLELIDMENLETVQFHATKNAGENRDGQSTGSQVVESTGSSECKDLSEQPNYLQIVMMKSLSSLRRVSSFRSPIPLQKFVLRECPSLEEFPSFQMCTMLDTLELDWTSRVEDKPINLSTLSALRTLIIKNYLGYFGTALYFHIEGLGSLTQLENNLILVNVPVRSLAGLDMLTKLRNLCLDQCHFLQELEGLDCLSCLESLVVSYTKVEKLAGLDKLLQLHSLDCSWCQELVWLPDLDNLPKLKLLSTRGCMKLEKYPLVPRYPFAHLRDPTCAICDKPHCSCYADPFESLDNEGEEMRFMFSFEP